MVDSNNTRKVEKISAVKGMNDILPPDSARWERLEEQVRLLMRRFAYENIRTPIVEPTALFVRGLGEVTDIVEKEMYSFEDRLNGEQLTLRPENTAGVVRAAIENSMLYGGAKRLYYMGPMFRHERPQRGRYRQFHQIGAEALGFSGGEVDAELILMASLLWKEIGLTDIALQINSLGQPQERHQHREALIRHFEQNASVLDDEAKNRLYRNPLRLLDSKNPAMQSTIEAAPKLLDFLGTASRAHLDRVLSILEANGIPFTINPRLVRGMDYYNLTVFEFVTTRLGAQGTICAGGRYDYLTEQMGGKPAPAVGWAMGVERVLELLQEQGIEDPNSPVDAYAVIPDIESLSRAMVCIQRLRADGVNVLMHASGPEGMASMKSQLKKADACGANYALIFGEQEISQGMVTIKNMRSNGSEQVVQPIDATDRWSKTLQSNA